MTVKVHKKKQRIKHEPIVRLGTDKVGRIQALMVQGESMTLIAAMIQDEWGEYTDVKAATLIKQLQRYKNDVVKGHLITTVKGTDEQGKETVVSTEYAPFQPKIDVHNSLAELVHMQQERLNKLYEREQKMPTNMDAVRKDIRELAMLYRQMSELEFDMGLLHRVPHKLKADVRMLSASGEEQRDIVTAEENTYDAHYNATHKVFAMLDEFEVSLGSQE